MVTRLTIDNLNDLYGTFEQFRQLFLVERPRPGSPTHAVLYNLLREGQAVAALSHYGYLLVHQGVWMEKPVLFLDEVWLHPQARKQGHLKELVEWLQGYCLYNGLSIVLLNTYGNEEARPLQSHLSGTPISMLMQISVPNDAPLYRSTYRPPVMAPLQVQPSQERPLAKEKRKRMKKVHVTDLQQRLVVAQTEAPQFLEQEPVVVMEEEQPEAPRHYEEHTYQKTAAGVLVPQGRMDQDGWVLPTSPGRM